MSQPKTTAVVLGSGMSGMLAARVPWMMSTMEDMRNRKFASPNLVARTMHGYVDLVLRSAVTDPALHVAFLEVMHMTRSPLSLMAPGTLAHVLADTTRRAFGPPPPRRPRCSAPGPPCSTSSGTDLAPPPLPCESLRRGWLATCSTPGRRHSP